MADTRQRIVTKFTDALAGLGSTLMIEIQVISRPDDVSDFFSLKRDVHVDRSDIRSAINSVIDDFRVDVAQVEIDELTVFEDLVGLIEAKQAK